jgi:7,8-dihydropterin-6-yl-methyl-4-(beta-D-ribofuranosyl)aminobenzene 5'-phosphate synthase
VSCEVRITVLVENSVNLPGLQAEHGLALHIQTGQNQLLFDTGPGDLLIQNAHQLQLNLADLNAVVQRVG